MWIIPIKRVPLGMETKWIDLVANCTLYCTYSGECGKVSPTGVWTRDLGVRHLIRIKMFYFLECIKSKLSMKFISHSLFNMLGQYISHVLEHVEPFVYYIQETALREKRVPKRLRFLINTLSILVFYLRMEIPFYNHCIYTCSEGE